MARLEVNARSFGLIRLTEVATTLLRRARRAQAVQVVIMRTQPGDEENRRLLSKRVDCHSRCAARRSFQIDTASALDGRSPVTAPFLFVCSSRAPPRRCSPFTFNRSHLDDVTPPPFPISHLSQSTRAPPLRLYQGPTFLCARLRRHYERLRQRCAKPTHVARAAVLSRGYQRP